MYCQTGLIQRNVAASNAIYCLSAFVDIVASTIPAVGNASNFSTSVLFHSQIPLGKMTPKEAKQTELEASLLARLDHPNIVAFWESFVSGTNLYIVMEFANGTASTSNFVLHLNKIQITFGLHVDYMLRCVHVVAAIVKVIGNIIAASTVNFSITEFQQSEHRCLMVYRHISLFYSDEFWINLIMPQ